MIQELRIVQAGKFLKLFKNDSLYATPIFRINKNRKNLIFAVLFKLDDDRVYALNRSQLGYSDQWQRLKTFTPNQLYQAMLSVPHRGQASIQVLQVPHDAKDIRAHLTYHDSDALDRILYGEKAGADAFDPFRDAHSAVFHTEQESFELVPNEDYQGIQDFHPFLQEEKQVLALPCSYQDPNRKMTIPLQLMGWYYLDKQLKISWKPANRPRARWRSSIVAIDRKTGRYFFQGNIYRERGTDPVFLEKLSLDARLTQAQAEFTRFIDEIKKQERRALLKLR